MYNRYIEKHFAAAQKKHKNWPVVISEGDSWFSYANVIGRLDELEGQTGAEENQRPWALLRLEENGNEVMTILSGSQRAKLRKLFKTWKLDALLFSGGGNDIIGPDLWPLLGRFQQGMLATQVVVRSRLDRRINQIKDCYRELLDMLADADQETTKVFVNSYDYVVPSTKGVKLFKLFKLAGPWVLPSLEDKDKKIPAELYPGVIKTLIDRFADAVDEVAAEPGNTGRLIRVETRNLIKDDWQDEIHPDLKGAKRVAAAFETALRTAGVIA